MKINSKNIVSTSFRMTTRLFLQVIGIFTICVTTVEAQNIDTYTQQLEANNHLKAMQQEHTAIQAKKAAFSTIDRLNVNGAYGLLPTETRLGAKRFAFGVSLPIKWPSLVKAHRRNVDLQAQNQQLLQQHHQVEMTGKLKNHLLYILVFQANVKALEEKEALTLQKSEWINSQIQVGKMPLDAQLKTQIKLKELKAERSKVQHNIAIQSSQVNLLTTNDLSNSIQLYDQLELAVIDSSSLFSNVENHPTLKMITLQQQQDQNAIDINDWQNKPQLSVGIDYGWVVARNDVVIADNGRDIIQPKIQLSIPINRSKNKAVQQEKQQHIAALKQHYQYEQNSLHAQLIMAWQQYQQAILDYQLYEDIIAQTHSILSLQQTQYTQNKLNYNILLETKIQLVHYRFLRYKAIVDSHIAQNDIETLINY